jgi:hypothetical protein
MAFIYNLSDTWNDAATTWNGIKLAVTNTGSSASSNLLNLTVTGATTASFVVDKSGNLALNGTVNKVTITAPATAATLTLADNSTFITSGAYSSTFTFSGTTTLTFPTSGTVTALGNTTTGSGAIVLATGPSITLTNATGLPLATGVTGTLPIANGGTGQTTANAAFNALVPSQGGNNGKYLTTDGSNTSWATNPLGTVTSVDVSGGSTGLSFSGGPITTSGTITMAGTLAAANGGTGLTSLGTGIATWLGTPSSANLAAAVTDETGSGPLVFATSPTFTSQVTFGTASSTRGTLVLANTSANTVTLQSSNTTAANYTLTFPAAAPVNGYYLQTDTNGVLSWAAGGGGGGGSPGGSTTQVQYNNAGAFGGMPGFTFDGTATVSLGVASTTSGSLKLYNSASANSVSIASGNNTASWTMTLPVDDGSNGQLLQTDGSGNLSWYTNTATGDVVGPASATDNAIARFDGTTGKLIQNSAVTVADTTGDITGGKYNGLTISTTTGTFTIANGKTLAVDNTLTFVGTDASTVSFGAGGTVAYTGGTLAQFASTTSAQLAGVISDETGSGSLVFATSPTLTTPILGTPTSGNLSNCTNIPVNQATGTLAVANGGTGITSFGTGVATWLGTPSSANLASAVTDETGSGSLVFATSPTLTTPRLAGSSSGYTSFASANSSATNYTATFPAENMTVGFRNIPAVGTKTGSYTLDLPDVGKYVQVGSGGSITIPNSTFAEGDVVSIFNNTSGNITLTCSITTAYIAGTDSDKATMTLATRGVATVLFISGTICVVSGNVT